MLQNSKMLTFDELIEINPEHLWIEFSVQEREAAWNQTVSHDSQINSATYRAFLNRLCLNSFVKWLEDEPELRAKFQIPIPSDNLDSQWKFVNGIDFNFTSNSNSNHARLVLIPNEQSIPTEFRIPQEWVDIPNWTANYYLPVQLNLEENWLRIWGFVSHEQVQKTAQYDSIDRTYCINNRDLIADIDVMWIAEELCPLQKPQTKSLASLSEVQAKAIIDKLTQANVVSPRLHVNFAEWGAILASEKYRSILYNQRTKCSQVNLMDNTQKAVRNLSLWFENIFDGGFRSLDDLLSLTDTKFLKFRSDSVLNEVCVKGAKLIDLGMQLESNSVALLIGLSPQVDNKVGIRVQLYPASGETYLPDSIQLTLLSESGITLQSVESRSYDNYIQLKRFKLPLGKNFSIQVARKEIKIKEDFVLEELVC
ncbi:MAG: DUF1822 family protein [Cyanobacteriota bacterium]|nr:DUF1822 family protein [Cyanobacteriota bacterium]